MRVFCDATGGAGGKKEMLTDSLICVVKIWPLGENSLFAGGQSGQGGNHPKPCNLPYVSPKVIRELADIYVCINHGNRIHFVLGEALAKPNTFYSHCLRA